MFLITGAASGIGKHLVEVLVGRGESVVAADIDYDRLVQSASGQRGDLRLCKLDVREPSQWTEALDLACSRGPLDVVMNVAGYLRPGRTQLLTRDDVDLHFDINTKGVIHGTRLAAQVMCEQGSGHIINIASIAALAPVPGLGLYSASKHAVRAFSLAAAEDLRPHGVAVTVVCPDAVRTPMLDLQVNYEEAAMTFATPTLLSVENIAELILGHVLSERPLEVAIPRLRKVLAHIANIAPGMTRVLLPIMQRAGRLGQNRYPKS